jgi:L-seryl-tRNA(Ser) seleniumtransferase
MATLEPEHPQMSKGKTIYSELGIKPLINGQGTYTSLGGSIMPPEVVQAMAEAAGWFVPISELQEKVGARIAGLLGVPAAMVTAGAASAISVATAACMTWNKSEALAHLPQTDGLKNEVIIQKGHHCGYEPQILLTGAKLVWVESRVELERAINARTAMMFFLNRYEPQGQIKREEWIQIGKEHQIPLVNDAAADIPPLRRFSEYLKQGFDLVAFSGGKALRGPQSSGLLLGRSDLVAAGRLAINPHLGIGRAMKVGKEEIIGLLAAVERFLKLDHDAEWRSWETKTAEIIAILGKIPGGSARRDVPDIANHAPHVVFEWSPWHTALSAGDVTSKLLAGDLPIAVLAEGERALRIAVWTLRENEHQIVARRIAEIFSAGNG